MRKKGSLVLVMLFLVIGVVAVLAVTYPELQQSIKEFLDKVYQGIAGALTAVFRPFIDAFTK